MISNLIIANFKLNNTDTRLLGLLKFAITGVLRKYSRLIGVIVVVGCLDRRGLLRSIAGRWNGAEALFSRVSAAAAIRSYSPTLYAIACIVARPSGVWSSPMKRKPIIAFVPGVPKRDVLRLGSAPDGSMWRTCALSRFAWSATPNTIRTPTTSPISNAEAAAWSTCAWNPPALTFFTHPDQTGVAASPPAGSSSLPPIQNDAARCASAAPRPG